MNKLKTVDIGLTKKQTKEEAVKGAQVKKNSL